MNCNLEIPNGLKVMGQLFCDFCDLKLCDYKSKQEDTCCDQKDILNDNGMNVCQNCGSIYGYKMVSEYVDFYENKHRYRRKSVYYRKYHIQNKINDISNKHKLHISYNNTQKIHLIFKEINKILLQVNGDRKRMVSINYILKQLFKMLRIPDKDIEISRSKSTLAYYKQYWGRICSLIGDKIESIVNQ